VFSIIFICGLFRKTLWRVHGVVNGVGLVSVVSASSVVSSSISGSILSGWYHGVMGVGSIFLLCVLSLLFLLLYRVLGHRLRLLL